MRIDKINHNSDFKIKKYTELRKGGIQMNSNEKRWIVLLVAVLLIAIVIIVVLANSNRNNKVNQVAQGGNVVENKEKYTTELNDGTKVNTAKEFNSKKMYGELEISNIYYTEQNGKTVLLADVTNKGNKVHKNEIVKITILGENGEEITTTKPVIGKMEPGETVKINATITANVSNAKDFKIEAVN